MFLSLQILVVHTRDKRLVMQTDGPGSVPL